MKRRKTMRLKLVVSKDATKEVKDLLEISDILLDDLERVIEVSDDKITQFKEGSDQKFLKEQETWFRLIIRILITTIEATSFKLKQLAFIRYKQRGLKLEETDNEKLTEQRSDGGLCFLSTAENLKYSVKMYAAAFDSKYKIKFGKEWATFLRVQNKRKGLTHPKSKSDLSVTMSDYKAAYEAAVWFTDIIKELFDSINPGVVTKL
jgi:hypothetical protein